MLQTPAQVTKVTTMGDRGIRVQIDTPELSPDDVAKIFELRDKQFWVAFKELEIKADELEIPEFIPEMKGDKSPAQRLRSVIYVYWEKQGKRGEFDTFYKQTVNKIIEGIKAKL